MFRTYAELNDLPYFAVVEDRNNEIFQKLPEKNAVGHAWFMPGSTRAYGAAVIELPARLLDDGL